MVNLKLHHHQTTAWQSKARIIAAISGIQGGKSTLGAAWLLRKVAICRDKDVNFIVAAPTYKIMSQSTLPTLSRIWPKEWYEINRRDDVLTFKNGNHIFLRSGTDPNSVEGIPSVGGIWGDEAGMYSRLFWENLQSRTAFLQSQLILTTTPYAMNWVKTDIVDAVEKHGREDICYVRWRSVDSPYFPQDEYDRQKAILDPKTFRRKYDAIHEKREGLVYDVFDDGNIAEPFPIPRDWRVFAGVDWGYNHAFAVTIRAISPDNDHYTIAEFKKSGLDPVEKASAALMLQNSYDVEMFYCGVDRPEMIDLFNDKGVRATGFFHKEDTRYREVVPGIELHASLIRTKKYRVFGNKCPHLIDEYNTYSWPEASDEKPTREVPIPLNDDLLSAERYVTIGTINLHETKPMVLKLKGRGIDWDDFDKASGRSKSWESY